MQRKLRIFTGLSLVILLLSINRLTSLTQGYLEPFEFLRRLDFNAMIPIPLASVLLYYLLLRDVVKDSTFMKTGTYTLLLLIFISGVYLFGASSGTHEVTNYLNTRFCERGETKSDICNIIAYNDDDFSHLVYYLGFILMNIALMFSESNVGENKPVRGKEKGILLANAIFIGLGIFANLAFEEIGLDLYFFGSMMLLSLYLLWQTRWRFSNYPVLLYFATAYSIGVLGTLIYKLLRL